MTDTEADATIALWAQLEALWNVAIYRPVAMTGIISLSVFAALMEGVGLSFLVPVIEIAQGNTEPEQMSTVGETFFRVYEFLGIPFTLELVVVGVGLVMVVRYTSSFLVDWLKVALNTDYVRHLQVEGFELALEAQVAYYDETGTDEVLNAIVTQAEYGGRVIRTLVRFVEHSTLSLVYLAIAIYIAPVMTILTGVLLGLIVLVMRYGVESGYDIGDRVAEANQRLQQHAQAGTQGLRDVKVFGLERELFDRFRGAADHYYRSSVKQGRNEAAMNNLFQLLTAFTVFVLIYFALSIAALPVAALGIFLFAIFRLAPRVSTLNDTSYKLAAQLPHLVRTLKFMDDLDNRRELDDGDKSSPDPVESIAFRDVSFSYTGAPVLDDVSFQVDRGEFVAFVGPSGAGKSTIVSLLMRLYEPDSGEITANRQSIDEFDLRDWRGTVSMVRQHPFIFNESLRFNVTVGNRGASEARIREVCDQAEVTEFLDNLPDGLDTELGDDGVRLSGGQRQRIALARALLKDSDVLVLDEATSDLDTTLEDSIQANLEATENDRILLVIAHRLSTVVNADRIYVVEDGTLVETGTHVELLASEGPYAELYEKQAQVV